MITKFPPRWVARKSRTVDEFMRLDRNILSYLKGQKRIKDMFAYNEEVGKLEADDLVGLKKLLVKYVVISKKRAMPPKPRSETMKQISFLLKKGA